MRVVVLLVLALLLAAGACAPAAHAPVATWAGDAATLRLEYRGEALAVYATGDFNGWTPQRHPFRRLEDGRWELSLSLGPGEYCYLLAIESAEGWSLRPDPANPLRSEDAVGRSLSLLRVGNDKAGDD